ADPARARHPARRRAARANRRAERSDAVVRARAPAVYMRGGPSRCLVFHERDLPPAGRERDAILLAALGSPDPYARQLDGLGGGISSLSKAVIIGPTTLPGADVDYTFAQVHVTRSEVDYTGNCGNCSSAVGPFAIEEGLVPAREGETGARLHNTNTKKLIVSRVPVAGGAPAVRGDFELPGVAGRGARIALDFGGPGGAGPGRLLPPGAPPRYRGRHDGVPGGRFHPHGLRPRRRSRDDRHRETGGRGRRCGALR